MTEIFVFGSNLAGHHRKGAALHALKYHFAQYGIGEGLQGTSYAIPTKDINLKLLPLNDIERGVRTFLEFAASSFDATFHVTPIACGLVAFQPKDIAPLFRGAPANCILPARFIDILHR